MSDLFNYIIYHKNCQDGFSSLIVLLKSKQVARDAIIYHDVPSAQFPPKEIDGKDIIIMDVAYKYNVLQEIFERAKSVVFIDHHVTVKEDIEKLSSMPKYKKKVNFVFDVNESGASLTWKFLFGNKKMPLYIKYIKDSDTGKWEYKDTKPFIYALRVKYSIDLKKDIVEKWTDLFDNNKVNSLIKTGKLYEEYAEALLEENSRKYSLEAFPSQKIYNAFPDAFVKSGQYKVAVVCGSGCPSTTLLANKIMDNNSNIDTAECDFVIIWTFSMEKKEYILSFRSNNVDVGKIAALFGGGGHKLASACSFPENKYHIQDLFFPNSLKKRT